MPNGKSLEELKKEYKKKGFNVHNLSDFVNIQALLEKARKAELRSLGITPINETIPAPTRKNNKNKKVKRELPNWEKSFLNKRLLAGIESNYNNIPFEFENLKPNGRNRSSTATSDPRSTSPTSKGGRRTRKQKRKSRKHTRKH